MPQFSSFAIQRQDATPVHDLIVTFILRTFAYQLIILINEIKMYLRLSAIYNLVKQNLSVFRLAKILPFSLLLPENRSTVVMCFSSFFACFSRLSSVFSRFLWEMLFNSRPCRVVLVVSVMLMHDSFLSFDVSIPNN